tara:strand:+ start:56 stop:682 length:627 start_codon:yes stop_codon:yes gene_type:complete
MNITKYKKHGWVHIQEAIPKHIVSELRERAIKWRDWVNVRGGTPSKYGPTQHWQGLGCAGMYDEYLMEFYTSDLMFEISSELLQTKDIWLYNDQIVVKLPNDDFQFGEHTDNSVGGNSNKGKNTINISVILDDFTDENGTLQIRDKKIYPKAGDIVAIHGDTPHQSQSNKSDKPRCLYACVYSDEKLKWQQFYVSKFNEPIKLNNELI